MIKLSQSNHSCMSKSLLRIDSSHHWNQFYENCVKRSIQNQILRANIFMVTQTISNL